MALPPAMADLNKLTTRALCGDHLHPATSWSRPSGRSTWCQHLPPPERGGVSRELRLIVIHLFVFLAFPCETPQSIPQHTDVFHPREMAVTRFKSQMAVD